MPVKNKYTAAIFGQGWAVGPQADFATLTECREWAQGHGTTADTCLVRDKSGRDIARYDRNKNDNGLRWFKAAV